MAELTFQDAIKAAHEAYQTTLQQTGDPASALLAAQTSLQDLATANDIPQQEVESVINAPEFQQAMEMSAEEVANLDFGPDGNDLPPLGEPAMDPNVQADGAWGDTGSPDSPDFDGNFVAGEAGTGDGYVASDPDNGDAINADQESADGGAPGFIPFDETGSAVFQETLNMGATPEQAFEAATSAMSQLAAEYGMPQGGWEADLTAAESAFSDAIANGSDPVSAFNDARAAGGEAAAEWAAGEAPVGEDITVQMPDIQADTPTEGDPLVGDGGWLLMEDSWSGSAEPFMPLDAAGSATFEAGITMQMPYLEAADGATNVMQVVGDAMELPPELTTEYINATEQAFNEGVAAGLPPEEAFYDGLAAGIEAGHEYALENPEAMPEGFPPMDQHQDGIEMAAFEAFETAQAEGLSPEATFEAVASAVQEAGTEQGIPQDVLQAGLDAAQNAFDSANAAGEPVEYAMESAMNAGGEAAHQYEVENYPEHFDAAGSENIDVQQPGGITDDPFQQMDEGYGDDFAAADGALAENADNLADAAANTAPPPEDNVDGGLPPLDGGDQHMDDATPTDVI